VIGADFYTGSGHKWLMGPAGVGFLVVNKAQLSTYNPNFMPLAKPGEKVSAAARSELGTPNHVSRMGTAYSIATLQQIGLAQIEEQGRSLSQRLREGLHSIAGVRNAGPDAWSLSSSITTLQVENGTPERMQQLVNILRDQYQIVTKFRPEVRGVRVAVAAFNVAEEIDKLLAALAKVVPTL
jgi:selenocysteine lyase/cysteine desulfurase